VATDVLYVLLFGLVEGMSRYYKVLMNVILSLVFAIISCDHPRRALVKYTAIVGASYVSSGIL
jgi:hypothetical protein